MSEKTGGTMTNLTVTCRVCREPLFPHDKYVHFGTRHNAHWNCKLQKLGDETKQRAFLRDLSTTQLQSVPYGVVKQYAWMPAFLRAVLEGRGYGLE